VPGISTGRRRTYTPYEVDALVSAAAVGILSQRKGAFRELVTDPVEIFRQTVGEPDDWQREFLADESRQIIVCCSRQVGKSSAAAVKALASARSRPRSLWILVGPTLRQAQELFERARDAIELSLVEKEEQRIGHPHAPAAQSALRVKLNNGSRIIALPGRRPGNVRGYSPDGVIIDEAAFCTDAIFSAISPMLAVTGGQLILLSTPCGQRGFFYQAWNDPSWKKYEVPWTKCPRISAEFIEQEKRRLGAIFAQEYLCQFLVGVTSPFDQAAIDAAKDPSVQEWELSTRWQSPSE